MADNAGKKRNRARGAAVQGLQDAAYYRYLLLGADAAAVNKLAIENDRSVPQMYAWIKAARERQADRLRAQDSLNGVERQLAGLRFVQREAMDAWHRSTEPLKRASTRKKRKELAPELAAELGVGHQPISTEEATYVEQRIGDSRYLQMLLQALGDERKLLGIDARRVREMLAAAVAQGDDTSKYEEMDPSDLLLLIQARAGGISAA